MSFLQGSDSIPPSFLPLDLVPSKRKILYLPGPQESWRPFPASTQQANLQLNSLPWIHSFHWSSSQRQRQNLRVTVQKRGHVWSLLLPASTCSLSAAHNACVLSMWRVSVSVSVLFATVPEVGEAPDKPKVCFWTEVSEIETTCSMFCTFPFIASLTYITDRYISALTCNFFSFCSYPN